MLLTDAGFIIVVVALFATTIGLLALAFVRRRPSFAWLLPCAIAIASATAAIYLCVHDFETVSFFEHGQIKYLMIIEPRAAHFDVTRRD